MDYNKEIFLNPLFEKIYQIIKSTVTDGITPVDSPVSVVLGGLPGAGKGNLYGIYDERTNNNIVHIDCDSFRKYHPQYNEFYKRYGQNGEDVGPFTNDFIFAVSDRLVDELSREKYNLIYESALKSPNTTFKHAQELKPLGYRVELAVMASSIETAWEGTIKRVESSKKQYEQDIKNGVPDDQLDPPRVVGKEFFTKVTDNICHSLEQVYTGIDKDKNKKISVDDIYIFTRNRDCIYHMADTPFLNPMPVLNARLYNTEIQAHEIINSYYNLNNLTYNTLTHVNSFSALGNDTLRKIAEDPAEYNSFMKYYGRIFKHNASVALEFYSQKTDARFIATREQWEKTGRHIKKGGKAIRLVDDNGSFIDYYDFSQVQEDNQPPQWILNKDNVEYIKKQFNINDDTSIIKGVLQQTIKAPDIISIMMELGIPASDYKNFSNSYINTVQLIIAGRLEIGGNIFGFPVDNTAFAKLTSNTKRIKYIKSCASVAQNSLYQIENVILTNIIKERSETENGNRKNQLREMENNIRLPESEHSGRTATDSSERTSDKRNNRSEDGTNKRETTMDSNSDDRNISRNGLLSGVHNGHNSGTGDMLQVRSDMRSVLNEPDSRTESRRTADWNIRNQVDGVYEGESSGGRRIYEAQARVSDNSTSDRQGSNGIPRTSGQAVRTGESTSDEFRGSSKLGTSQDALLQQHSNERESLDSSIHRVNIKNEFMTTEYRTEKASPATDDAFIISDDESDEEKLVSITGEINSNESKATQLINEKQYEKAIQIMQKLVKLNKQAEKIKKITQEKPITEEDIQALRNIRPSRKSVQNMLECEIAQTPKFEKLLFSEFREKSAYEMRKTNNEWMNDETKTISIINIDKVNIPDKISDIRREKNIERGVFINTDTNSEIIFSKRSIEEIVSKSIQDEKRSIPVNARLSSLYQVKKIIQNAICFDSHISEYNEITSKNKSPNTLFMHQMYGVIKYDDNYYLTKLSIEESYFTDKNNDFQDTSNRLYNLRDIKIEPIEANRTFDPAVNTENGTEDTSIGSNLSISLLYKLVKEYDKNFYENPDAVGREEREAELFAKAAFNDAGNTIETGRNETPEINARVGNYAQSRGISAEEAANILRQKVNKQRKIHPITNERRKEILSEFALQHDLTGELFVKKLKGSSPKVYYLTEKENDTITLNEELFTLEPGEYFSEQKLSEALKKFNNSDALKQHKQNKLAQTSLFNVTLENESVENTNGIDVSFAQELATQLNTNNINNLYTSREYVNSSISMHKTEIQNKVNISELFDEYLESVGKNMYYEDIRTPFKENVFRMYWSETAEDGSTDWRDTLFSNQQEYVADLDGFIATGIDVLPDSFKQAVMAEKEKANAPFEAIAINYWGETAANDINKHLVSPKFSSFITSKIPVSEGETAKRLISVWNNKYNINNNSPENSISINKESYDPLKTGNIIEFTVPKRKTATRAEKLYKQFADMYPEITNKNHHYEKFGDIDSDIEPLTIENIGKNTYSFMTFYFQNGDLMRDPEFTFSLDDENKTLDILEYRQDGVPAIGSVYQSVVDETGNKDKKLLASLEKNFKNNLDAARNAERNLTSFIDQNGKHNLTAKSDIPEVIEVIEDRSPELRDVLNKFSEKHKLGELNITPRSGALWSLSEKMINGSDFLLGSITHPEYEYGKPFTADELQRALDKFEETTNSRNMKVSQISGRENFVNSYGGITTLPPVKPLPEISYESRPTDKASDNVTAIREMIRLENARKNGTILYDKKVNQLNSKQNSDERLRKYSGWGGVPQFFDEKFKQFNYLRESIKEMVSQEEYADARASTLNSHYTSSTIIDAMYRAVQGMKLPRDARILEPSCGTGNFISRLPHNLKDARITGIELDSLTARIATQIFYEDNNINIINNAFEKTNIENKSFDLVIGNVPFGDYTMNDPDYVQDWKIHDAFFRRALDKVAPGGVVAFITSSGTMDKKNPKVREYLSTQANLIGAIRLPNNAFSTAGTKVTSDIIFLQKREVPLLAHEPKPDWCYTIPNEDGLMINSYFVENPQMLLGKMEKTTHFDMLTCKPIEGAELISQLDIAINTLNAKIDIKNRDKKVQEMRDIIEPWGNNFSYQIQNNEVYYRQNDKMLKLRYEKKDIEKIKELIELRTVARKLIELQKTSISDDKLIPYREKLNLLYDDYISKYNSISLSGNIFNEDLDYPILRSLENSVNGKYVKADIFYQRTVNAEIEIKAVDTPEEALQISIDQKGSPDIIYMASLLQNNYPDDEFEEIADKICDTLLDKELIFIDPEKRMPNEPFSGIVESSEYLSGNVRMKLTLAEELSHNNPIYIKNVTALKSVIPEDIKAEEITANMGCAWIDVQDYTEFLSHLSGRNNRNAIICEVSYSPITGEFTILNAGSKKDLNINETTTYGTNDYSLYKLAEKILNQRKIDVKAEKPDPKDPSKTITRTNPKATRMALDKAKLIKEEFKKWIFNDPERKAKYERKYNDIFNSLIGRKYDGSNLTFPGMTSTFTLRSHQKNCISRAIHSNTLAAHVVGAGKSAVIITTVMKKKQLGLINKSCVVVPKALTEQTANEWRKLYPDAKILTVTAKDLATENNRNLFTARVATGAYDAVIMSQEQYEKMAMSPAYQKKFIQNEIDQLEDILREQKSESSGKKTPSVKEIESQLKRLKNNLDKLLNPKSRSKAKDELLEFEQLGFDYLVVDEAHAYKNGFVITKMSNVSGVTSRTSGRAEDMQMKTDYFNEQFGNGHILFATGTPVSNSMTELYVMTRYLRPDLLKQAGIEHFDDWAATFGNVISKNQQTADGRLKLKTKFANFSNLPELMTMYKEFADIQSADKLNLPRPELKTGRPQVIKVEATPEQIEYVKELAERAKACEDGLVNPSEDNLLKITGEARLVGLGNEAIKSLYNKQEREFPFDTSEEKSSKVDKCIEKVFELYKKTNDTKGVQIIFSDIAVNSDNNNFSVYNYIKNELINNYHIPENEIVFAPKSDSNNRENIFRDINNSKYRIVIASTGTLGTGANIQQNLYALHHIDCPWKPSDFEQREGRILRQGNKNTEVEIINYVTEGTLDSYLYQTVTDKARFIAQLLDNNAPARVSEDCDEKVLTFGEIQAAAEGNPDFKRRIELSNEVAELKILRNEYNHETAITKERAEKLPNEIEKMKALLIAVEKDNEIAKKIINNNIIFFNTDTGITLQESKEINTYLHNMVNNKKNGVDRNATATVSSFKVSADIKADTKLSLSGSDNITNQEILFTVKGESTYTTSAGTAENQNNYVRLKNVFENVIPKRYENAEKRITDLETSLVQANERVATPFMHESELKNKIKDLQELEIKLSGLSIETDEIIDADEEPIIEINNEAAERQKVYNVDNDDFQPTVDEDDNDNHFSIPTR